MAIKNVDMEFWRKDAGMRSVATRGFNHLVEIPRLIKEAHPDFKDWDFGFCNADALPLWRAEKWIHVQPSHFPEFKDFNREIAARFRLNDKDGVLMYKDKFLMMMPKTYRAEILKDRREASNQETRSSIGSRKSRADGYETETTLEEKEISMTPEKRGPGRPRKL